MFFTTKIQLTKTDNVFTTLDFVSDSPIIESSRDDFDLSIQYSLQKIFKQIDECLNQAQVNPKDITVVILTGGSTEIPVIQKLISEYFPNASLSQENKLSSVSVGLAYDSMRKFGLLQNNPILFHAQQYEINR